MTAGDKIEQYLLLAKGLRGPALKELIVKATAEPGLFTFGELLALPQVQQLGEGEHAATLALLQLFAYGTLADYRASADKYGPLSDPQTRKLRVLTVATLATSRRTLGYAELQDALGLDTVRALEDLLITDCIYGGVLKGRLDQRGRCLHVETALTRDVAPSALPGLVATLREWLVGARGVLAGIEAQVAGVAAAAAAVEKRREDAAAAAAAARTAERAAFDSKAALEGAAMAADEGDMAAMMEGFAAGESGRPSGPRNTKRRR